jgi:hypothetical protein
MDNTLIVERVFQFAAALRTRNSVVARAFERAMIPLLEYRRPLEAASQQDLLRMSGIGPETVQFIQRIIAGEDVASLVAEVPEKRSSGRLYRRPRESKENTWETKYGTDH